jgi:hypothetical protein
VYGSWVIQKEVGVCEKDLRQYYIDICCGHRFVPDHSVAHISVGLSAGDKHRLVHHDSDD